MCAGGARAVSADFPELANHLINDKLAYGVPNTHAVRRCLARWPAYPLHALCIEDQVSMSATLKRQSNRGANGRHRSCFW